MIDIIIPVYNDKKHLRYALASIAMQSIRDKIAIYIVDDASTESYNDVIKEFIDILQINYFHLSENMGPGYARQYGIYKSKGNYICFMDSDDVLYNPRSIELLYKEILKGADYVCGNEYDEKHDMYLCSENNLHGKMYDKYFIYKNMVKFNNTRFHEDCYFNNIVLICNPIKKFINETVYFYSKNDSSISSISYDEYFSKLEILFINIKQTLLYAYENNCRNQEIQEFIDGKNIYLKRVYKNSSKEKQLQIKNWVEKYGLQDFLSTIYK